MDSANNDGSKKLSLEELSREDLLKKCKGLLVLAQKAKQAKDALQEENDQLKIQIAAPSQKDVTNEIIEKLTQQKLSHVTIIEELKAQNIVLNSKIQNYIGNLQSCDEKINQLDSENVSLKRQTNRLTDENEQLLTHLDSLEKQIEECKRLGLEQQNQLLALEKSKKILEDANNKLTIEQSKQTPELQKMLSISLEEVKILKNENAVIKETLENAKLNMSEKDKNILIIGNELQEKTKSLNELEALKLRNLELEQLTSEDNLSTQKTLETIEKLKDKLKFFHSKIVKLAVNAKALKEDKNEILLIFKQYMNQVEEWKTQLNNFTQKLIEFISSFAHEKIELQKENQILKDSNSKYLEQLKAHKTDDEKTKDLIEIENIKTENKNLNIEMSRLQILHENTNLELGNVKEENNNLREQVENLLKVEREYTTLIELRSNDILDNQKLQDENTSLRNDITRLLNLEKEHIGQFETFKNEQESLQGELTSLLHLEDEYKNQIEALMIENNVMRNNLISLEERHQKELQQCNDQNKIDDMEVQQRTAENEKICIEYRKTISKLEENIISNLRELDELKQKNSNLQEQFEHSQSTDKQIADRTSEEILKLVQENAILVEMNQKFQEARNEAKEIHTQTEKLEAESSDHEELIASLKRENAELLTEMNEMNQALKERGEAISKFQAHCEEVKKKLQIYESQANKNVDNISQKEERIKDLEQQLEMYKMEHFNDNISLKESLTEEKDTIISELKAEIELLKEKLNSNVETSYADSENMSTSTISRTEEVNRLKDLEGSWEEKYGKLRSLAIKLKGKARDLSAELLNEQNEKNEIQQKCTNNIKTIATLQAQCDTLQDELDKNKKQVKGLVEKLDQAILSTSKDKQKLAENEEIISSLKKEVDVLIQEKTHTETWKKQISGKVQTFRKELEAHKVLKKEFESKIAKLTSELEVKQQALKAETDCHQQTKNSLETFNNERKKNSVLNLEMQDYERSVKDLTQKLEKKQEEIIKLQGQVDSQKNTINAVREQNKILEERVDEVKDEIKVLQTELLSNKKHILELDDAIAQKDEKNQEQTQLLEEIRSENEELSTELSKLVAEHQKTIDGLKTEKELLRSQVLGLQQNLRETQDNLKFNKDELNAVQKDYENYKVRAQSVLRQNQTRDVGLEEKLSEELSTAKIKYEDILSEMNEYKTNLETLKQENNSLLQSKSILSTKYEEAVSEANDLKTLYDQLTNKYQQVVIENSETVRGLKVHAETLAQCYRQQLSEQEVRHNREVLEMQSKIDKVPSPSESPFPPLLTMPREEGEGSESTDTTNKNMHPVPLERLLGDDTVQEVAYLKKQLNDEESKIIHLTALLSDTEQDLAKHAQMNKLLKEEIRRQQRSVEREKHAENLEYLKNVVFKFVTLSSGDERSRLVPVLNTILKLSPEETQKLTMVARGEPGLRGWSNYLPLWSSPTKPS